MVLFLFWVIWGEWDCSHVCDVGRNSRVRDLLSSWLGLRQRGMADPVWVSSEEIVVVSSSPSSDSDTLHRMEERLDNLMAEIALDLGESIYVMDVGSHVSSSDPLLQEVEEFSMTRSREEDDLF